MTRILVAILLLAVVNVVLGAENNTVGGSIGTVSAEDWNITGLEFAVELSESGLRGDVNIERIALLTTDEHFDNINVTCDNIALTTQAISCARATVTATIPGIDRQTVPGAFSYQTDTGHTHIELNQVAIAGGLAHFDIVKNDSGMDIRFEGETLQLDKMLALARHFGVDLAKYSATGTATASGRLRTGVDGSTYLDLISMVHSAAIANETGTLATDNLSGQIELNMTIDGDIARFSLGLESDEGEAYLEPAYANFGEHAIRLTAEQIETSDFETYAIARFRLQQESLLELAGAATVTFPKEDSSPINLSADIELGNSSVTTLYSSLLQVQLAGTILSDLDTDGRVFGTIKLANNELMFARLQLEDLILDDRAGRFAIYGLGGFIDWPGAEPAAAGLSELHWDSGLVHDIIIGASAAEFRLGDNDVQLMSPLRQPTMGGALIVHQLVLNNFGSDDATGVLDAELEPIQIGQLAGAFGWPAFSGTLSGKLPLLQLAKNTATIGGTLTAQAFDGDIEMTQLLIEKPFGLIPRLSGDIRMRGLDLQRVTDAFSFGAIQGRLSGDVTGLVLENWRPVAMDMSFYSPPNDKSQHRISQRAVENLANVGGGGAAALLSTGVLKFFDVFAYDRIGLRCVLRDGICTMSGAGPVKDGPLGAGYYIVKGSGLPRIDVVGYRDQVSWPRLVRQLAAINSDDAPTIN